MNGPLFWPAPEAVEQGRRTKTPNARRTAGHLAVVRYLSPEFVDPVAIDGEGLSAFHHAAAAGQAAVVRYLIGLVEAAGGQIPFFPGDAHALVVFLLPSPLVAIRRACPVVLPSYYKEHPLQSQRMTALL